MTVCQMCDGRGSYPDGDGKAISCGACNGDGEINPLCGVCDASGTFNGRTCGACNGDGVIGEK